MFGNSVARSLAYYCRGRYVSAAPAYSKDLGSRFFFDCWFGRRLVLSCLLALLQLLLLLGVFLCQLLGLLLMLLL